MTGPQQGMTKHLAGTGVVEAIERVTDALKTEGFGILTRIDVKETFKKKIDVDFRPYVILGACNPHLAHRALTSDPQLGLLLPCNVVVQEEGDGVLVSVVDPRVMSEMSDAPGLPEIAGEATAKLERALQAI
ncbi:MAG: DUF302 domain-containing protein [Planctomycetota bacterium]|jgi:uncharacterized protein (DUF302 family)